MIVLTLTTVAGVGVGVILGSYPQQLPEGRRGRGDDSIILRHVKMMRVGTNFRISGFPTNRQVVGVIVIVDRWRRRRGGFSVVGSTVNGYWILRFTPGDDPSTNNCSK